MISRKSQNTSINKTLLPQIVFIVIIIFGVFIFEKFFNKGSFLTNTESGATLSIDFDNMKRAFEGEVVKEMTVLDALNAAVAAGKIKLTYLVDGSNNTRIMEINDHLSDGGKQFGFYVNSKKLDPNELNRTYIREGDKIVIKLE